jgi:hypothetical protein
MTFSKSRALHVAGVFKGLDLSGQRFGKLVATTPLDVRRRSLAWLCVCDCGATKEVRSKNLTSGRVRSCGCLIKTRKKREMRHGHGSGYGSPTYLTWRSIFKRCTNPKDVGYPRYGGRGIKVCERWKVFENFLADMGERPAGCSIDRIDSDGNYEPGNCRWATAREQNLNKRRPRAISAMAPDVIAARKSGATFKEIQKRFGIVYASIVRLLATEPEPTTPIDAEPTAASKETP